MKIKIISDSTCDLSAQLIAENNITLTPLTVVKNDEQFKDGVTITPAEIFAHVADGGALCSTAANSIGEYADVFEKCKKVTQVKESLT
jgi:fatty acid-binding protein DegV